MNHISLFSGIGGFDLAAQWMGWNNVAHCEWNPFAQKILKYYWPNAISYEDITKTDFTVHAGTIDVLTGGFPCQPYSNAGKRKGKADDRHLWPEMLRAIREIRPRWIVGENVRGLTNWDGGLVFDEVQSDLENEGYEVTPFLLPACAVNAPHRRDRIWFIAYAHGNGYIKKKRRSPSKTPKTAKPVGSKDSAAGKSVGTTIVVTKNRIVNRHARVTSDAAGESGKSSEPKQQKIIDPQPRKPRRSNIGNVSKPDNSDTNSKHVQRRPKTGNLTKKQSGRNEQFKRLFYSENWRNFPTESPVCHGNDGIPAELDTITVSKWINESLKGGGNAVVPQLVLQFFKSIEQYEKQTA